jgi:hypothetical protein
MVIKDNLTKRAKLIFVQPTLCVNLNEREYNVLSKLLIFTRILHLISAQEGEKLIQKNTHKVENDFHRKFKKMGIFISLS